MLLRFRFRFELIFFYVSRLRAGTQAESVISLLVISAVIHIKLLQLVYH